MHNLKEIRKDFDAFKKSLDKRSIKVDFDKLKELDKNNREFIQKNKDYDVYFPCGYNYIESELNRLNLDNDKQKIFGIKEYH